MVMLNFLQVTCKRDKLCLPDSIDPNKASKLQDKSFMVLVRPKTHDTWQELLDKQPSENEDESDGTEEAATTIGNDFSTADSFATEDVDEGAGRKGVVCEVGLDLEACHLGEECVALAKKSRNGVCQCKEGWVRKEGGSGQECEEIEGNKIRKIIGFRANRVTF